MTLFLAKLHFLHRRLWQRDGTYRYAVLLGPPPLLGAGVAALVWTAIQAFPGAKPVEPPPPWAVVSGPRVAVSTDAPHVVAPGAELPASGVPANLVPGWRGGIQPVEISPTMDANVLQTQIAPLTLDQPSLDLRRIIAAGPAAQPFVGVGTATLVIRKAGDYGLTLRVQRTDTEHVTCLQRLVFGNQRVVSTLGLNIAGPSTRTFEPISFTLQPGLYPISIAFGCWDGRQEKGEGTLTLMIRPPGEQGLRPARDDEILQSIAVRR